MMRLNRADWPKQLQSCFSMTSCKDRKEPLALQVKVDCHGYDDRQSLAIAYLCHLRCKTPAKLGEYYLQNLGNLLVLQ